MTAPRPLFCPRCPALALRRTLIPSTAGAAGLLGYACDGCGYAAQEAVPRLRRRARSA